MSDQAAPHTPRKAADSARPPVVLQVLPSLVAGGVERTTIDITRALTKAGWKAIVASEGGRMQHQVEKAGGLHISLPLKSKNWFRIRKNAKALQALIEEHEVDIVHARSRAPAWSAWRAARDTDRPFVTTFHGTYNENFPGKWWYNSVMAMGDVVIANSKFIANHIKNRYPEATDRVVPIPRGIDMSLFNPDNVPAERLIRLTNKWNLPDDRPIVMLPGRMARWKGHKVLIDALALLDDKNLRCLIVGDDQGKERYRDDLDNQIRKKGLQSVVQFTGPCDDMPAAYMSADVVISASTDPEAFGRVPVEGQAMGRPVIATKHGGATETVDDGKTGWLVPPNDAKAMADAVTKALAFSPEQRETLSKETRHHVRETYDLETMCSKTLDIYRDLIVKKYQMQPDALAD